MDKQLYPRVFPMMCQCPDGATRIAKDHLQMSAFMGEPYGPDGKRIAKQPPSIDEVLAAGYSRAAAESIVENEAAKASQGIEPYGARSIDEFVAPAPQPTVEEPSAMTMLPVEEYITPGPDPITQLIEDHLGPELRGAAISNAPEPEPIPDITPKNKGGRPRKVQE